MARYVAALCESKNSTSQKLLNDVVAKLQFICFNAIFRSQNLFVCFQFTSKDSKCMVCTYVRRYERIHLILDSC